MKKMKILSVVVLGVLFFSCANNSISTEVVEEKKEKIINAEVNNYTFETEAIALDNGNKWKVVDDMLLYIRNMEKEVTNFSAADEKNYIALSVSLQNNIDLLTSKCTMTGQGHDELHKWLVPYIDKVNELKEAENTAEAEKHFQELQVSFTTFNQYFQ